jgi:solute carrier family 25 uncoupling protein 27
MKIVCFKLGILSLWAGVTPAVYRHLVYTGGRIVFYEKLREYFKSQGGSFPLWYILLFCLILFFFIFN